MTTVLDEAAAAATKQEPKRVIGKATAKRKETLADRLLTPGVLEGVVSLGRRAAGRGMPAAGKEAESLYNLLDGVRQWMHECGVIGDGESVAHFIAEAQAVGGQKDLKARVAELREMEFRGVIEAESEAADVPKRRKKKGALVRSGGESDTDAETEGGGVGAQDMEQAVAFPGTSGALVGQSNPPATGEDAGQRAERNRLAAMERQRQARARRAAQAGGAGAAGASVAPVAPPSNAAATNVAAEQSAQARAPVVVSGEDAVDMYDMMEAEMAEMEDNNDAEMEVLAEIGGFEDDH